MIFACRKESLAQLNSLLIIICSFGCPYNYHYSSPRKGAVIGSKSTNSTPQKKKLESPQKPDHAPSDSNDEKHDEAAVGDAHPGPKHHQIPEAPVDQVNLWMKAHYSSVLVCMHSLPYDVLSPQK
jgi:hypothetical protein